jgi:hypothetical protein
VLKRHLEWFEVQPDLDPKGLVFIDSPILLSEPNRASTNRMNQQNPREPQKQEITPTGCELRR